MRVILGYLGYIVFGIFFCFATAKVNRMYEHAIKQAEETKEQGTTEKYVVSIPPLLGQVSLANVVLAAIILVVNVFVWKRTGKMGDGMVQFCLIYMGIFLFIYAGVKIWWIKVDADEMEIHRFLRPTRKAKFSEVERVREDKWHQLVVYSKGHRLVTVNLMCENRSKFDASLARYGVDMSAIPYSVDVIRSVYKEENDSSLNNEEESKNEKA